MPQVVVTGSIAYDYLMSFPGRFMFDPGQQVTRLDGEALREGAAGARILICNEYELELITRKTTWSEADVLERVEVLVVTRGERGVSVVQGGSRLDVPAVSPRRLVDPTGVGDAFRGGFAKGLLAGADYRVSAQLGNAAATWVLEHRGGQSHAYSWPEFEARYAEHFGPLAL